MNYKFEYKTDEEKTNILNQNKDKVLIEEQNLFTGNFLIFSDVKPLENQISELQDNQLILMNAIADLYAALPTSTT
ncbi:hypothetical protein [Clostridium luticellarii]|uniref:Uncharacterized protein n=1 Tax=Clostridium luticellarii TaxID=1691940 RepID=A0A2T0BQ32_9CLOT|nr:hypothetical protein [Clostridium luticellarii]PRR85945.1 hypothetical protein CLLU_09730 [Clostridium luticellarii]